ncbi:MAG: hypothetical protein JNK72_20930 [Myxococcales bacterium]|nr:hypothetical protein [Myxococcales bacterium]
MQRPLFCLWVFSLGLALSACAGTEVEPRAVDAGFDAGRDVAAQQDQGAAAEVGVDAPSVDLGADDDAGAPPSDSGLCRVNNDGVINRNEMAFLVGASVLYAVNDTGTTVEPVDLVGAPHPDRPMQRLWSFSAPVMSDRRILDEVMSPSGRWWSSSYADATFATVADRSTNLLGVYRVSDTELQLLGTVSTEANRTNLRFSPPVTVLRFPLREGDTWEQTVNGSGFVNFTPLNNVSRFTNRIDAAGEVRTPAGRFQALRLRTDLDQSIPLTVFRVTRRTFTFVSECWGVVARVISTDNESTVEFRRASEYRRLGL